MSISKQVIIILLGLWIVLLPFLGFPGLWETFFMVGSGFLIVVLSLLMIARYRLEESRHDFFEDTPADMVFEMKETIPKTHEHDEGSYKDSQNDEK